MSEHPTTHAAVAAAAASAPKALFLGGTTAAVGGLTSTEMVAIVGAVIASLGFVLSAINFYVTNKRNRREHVLKMQLMNAEVEKIRAETAKLNKKSQY